MMASNSRRLLVIAINLCFFKEYQQAGFNFTKCKFSQFGGDYIGTIAVTKSGIRCQMWTGIEQIHKVDERIRDTDFPDGSKSLAKNYCRNPTNDSRGLWCYTIEKSVEIEECDIPLCNYGENRVTGTGVEYGGKFKTSLSQKECKFWKTRHTLEGGNIATQTKRFPNDNFPEYSRERAKNYCRNPDGDNGGPWCYVDGVYENIVHKEYCDVPLSDDRDCLVYTRSIDSYSTITKLDYSLQNITVWIKLWNPTFNYKTMATLVLSHIPVPATGKVIADLWKAGAEIVLSNTLTGLIYPGLNFHTNFKHTPNLITGENWTAITISWSLGYVTISLANSTEIIYAGEYAVKDSLSTLYPDGFLFYGFAGDGILWSTDLCQETCEIHTTFGYRYLRIWPIHSSYKSYSINFFLRSSFAISIQLYQTPGLQFPYYEIKMTQKGLITVIYQETSDSRIYEIKNVESSDVLDYWTWEEFTISIFGSDLYILVHKYYGGVELLHAKDDLFVTVRWFSIGSERIAHWTLYCTPESKDLSEEISPPNCIASKEEKYEGSQWFTTNYFPCALWSSDMVPNDQKKDDLFPDGSVFNATNKCRKINFDATTPYCYALWDSTATTAYKADCLIPACRSASCRVVGTANDYIGTLSETRSGRRCVLWLDQPGKKSEKKYLNDTLYPEQSVKDASNYCRNPSQSAAGTWCYTTDPLVSRDLCRIKDCDLPGEYIFLIQGDNVGRRMYILPKYRVEGIKINVKIWIPDDPDFIIIVFDADDGLKSSYKLIIGAENNSKILLYYKSEEKDYELVKEQIAVHILFIARWSEFIIKIPRGKVQVYRDATSLLFEWEHEDPLKSFLPIYYYFSTEKNLMAVSYDCVSTCHVEITTTDKIEKFFPIFSEDNSNMQPQKLEFMIRSNGDVKISLILFPEDFEFYVLKIGQSTSTITLLNSYMTFLFPIVEKKSSVEQLLSEKEWSNITITWVNRTMQVFWNTVKLLDYEHTHPFVFYFFSVTLRTGFAKWTVNCLPPVTGKTNESECVNPSGIVDKLDKTHISNSSTSESGIDYPLDLWYLISEHIKPEDVGKFSVICKSSYYVTRTGKFWFHLYKRYYKPLPYLPERLRPECMVLLHGIRACVIRTLHFTYFSSLEKVNKNPYLEQEEPHSLVKRRCCLMWHKKGENHWFYYFKLKDISNNVNTTKNNCISNIINEEFHENNMLEEVAINPENNCRILRVTCLNYGMIPLVNSLILQSVKMDLSPGFKHHRLHLNFSSNYSSKVPTHVVILSGVVDCKVIDWWHPCYPHHDRVIDIPLPAVESWDF